MTRKFKLKAPEDRASKNINLRVTRATYNAIEARAKSRGLTITKYMHRTALGRPILTNNADIIRKLDEVYRLQKELGREDPRNEHEYLRVMQTIIDTILQIPLRTTNRKN